MARNVGSIEVTVDADTTKLKAQLRKAGAEGGKSAAQEIEEALDDIDAEIGVEVKAAALQRVEERIEESLDDLMAEVGIDVDSADLKATEAKIDQALDGAEAMVTVDIDNGSMESAKIRLNQSMDGTTAEVEVSIDRASKAAADAYLEQNMDETGAQAGQNFGKSFGGNMSQGKWIAAGIAAIGDALTSGLSGVAAAATSVISSAVQGLGGAAGAAAPLVAGLATALGAGVVGAQGFGDALKVVNEEFATAQSEGRPMNKTLIESSAAFRNLAPAAQDAAMAFADVRDELGQLRQDVQQRLFSGFADEIRSMADETIPDMSDALEIAAGSVNEFGHQLAAVAKNTNFADMMKEIDPALDDAFDAATSLADTLEPFLKAAAPAAERLAEMIERGAEGLNKWVRNNPTEISDFLDDGLTSLESWLELLKSTGDLLGTIFKSGADSGDGFVVALNNIIERWDGWLESARGQDALNEFFESGQSAMKAFAPVLDGLKEALHVLITPDTMTSFQELGQAIGDMLPVLAGLISFSGKFKLAEAFANVLTVLGPFVDLLNAIPAPLLEIAGTAIVVVSGILKINAALKAFGVVSEIISLTNPYLLAFTAAITVAVIAMEAFKGKSEDVKARTNELTTALQNNVDAMINSGDASSSAALGMEALNKSLAETGEGGEKLMGAFAKINEGAGDATLGIDDTTRVLMGLRKEGGDSTKMLEELATGYGLPADAAKELADMVNETDDNFTKAQTTGTVLGMSLEDLAEKTGMPVEELIKLAQAMEETQDQAENTDFDKIAQAFIDTTSTGTEAEQAILAKAQADQKAGKIAEGVVPLYEAVAAALNEQKNAQDEASDSTANSASSYELVNQAIEDAIAAKKAEEEALKAERAAAMDTYQAQLKLAGATERAAAALADSMGIPQEYAEGLIDIGNAAHDAADEAAALSDALDLLMAPMLDQQEAISNYEAGIDDLTQAMIDNGKTLDLGTEAGRTNAEQIRTNIGSITDWAAAQLAAGESNTDTAAAAALMTEALIQQSAAFFTSSDAAGTAEDQARAYIAQLGLTPESISTLISQPGLIDALLNAADLTLLYDAAGNPVITEFEALGIDPAIASTDEFKSLVEGLNATTGEPTIQAPTIPSVEGQVEGLQDTTDTLDSTTASPTVTIPTAAGVKTDITGLQTALDKLGRTTATPTIQMPSYSSMKTNVDNLQRALDSLDRSSATPSISIPTAQGQINKVNELDNALDTLSDGTARVTVNNVQESINKVNELDRAINGLSNKTVTVTTNNVTRTTGGMAGALITGPRNMNVGEHGLHEALIPLQLPLSRVNPEVRAMAEMLRTGSSPGQVVPGTGKVVNNYMTITPASADPGAVASQIINRAASLANR